MARARRFCCGRKRTCLKFCASTFSRILNWKSPWRRVLHLHRQAEDSDIYFVTNTSEFYQENSALFRTVSKSVELWDAETGE